jgi:hypothetical protein
MNEDEYTMGPAIDKSLDINKTIPVDTEIIPEDKKSMEIMTASRDTKDPS